MSTLVDETKLNEKGWLWPAGDTETLRWLEEESDIPAWVMSHVPVKGVAVQAGGNCGLYVRDYAEAFEIVHTFEPQAAAFRCLVHNVPLANVHFYRAALGEFSGAVAISAQPEHCGGGQVVEGVGTIPQVRLDDFGLARVDLVHLDIEGFELKALSGAKRTLKRCRPVVALEINGRCADFGVTYDHIAVFMTALGYQHAAHHRSEHLFTPATHVDRQ